MGELTIAQRQALVLARARAATSLPQTNIVEQAATGTNIGLSQTLGMPVDMLTGGLNLAGRGISKLTGMDVPRIEKPFGGSESIQGALSPFISDVDPQTGPQKVARRVGEEVGAGAPLIAAMPAMMGGNTLQAAASQFPKFAAQDITADIGAGLGASAAQAVAPDSQTAEIIGALMGGGSVIGAQHLTRPKPQTPSIDDLKGLQSDAYANVDASQARLTPQSTEQLSANILRRMTDENVDEVLHPRTSRMMGIIEERAGQTPTIGRIENLRRAVGQNVAGSPDPSEARLGAIMKQGIDDYLSSIGAKDFVSGSSDEAAETLTSLQTGRDLTGRIKRTELVEGAIDRAERQAASSGVGGNVLNTTRQRLKSILDSDKLRRGFSTEDISAMEDIVRGTPTKNALRWMSRFSPTSGNLSALSGLAQGYGAATINPLLATPAALGLGAKAAAETIGKRDIANLLEQLRSGGPVSRPMSPNTKAVTASLLGQQLSGLGQ